MNVLQHDVLTSLTKMKEKQVEEINIHNQFM